MTLFFVLLLKLIPLYLLIIGGYLVTKFFHPNRRAIAPYIVYIVIPVVVFDTIYHMKLSSTTLLLPVIFWLIASFIATCYYVLARHIWKDTTSHLVGFATGASNFGYFGIPVAILLFGEEVRTIAVLFLIAYMLYESTVGYAVLYPHHISPKLLLKKFFSLPAVYAALIGLAVNISGITLPGFYADMATSMYGAFVVLGALTVGIGFAQWKKTDMDWPFLFSVLGAKFIVWPIFASALILLDSSVMHLFNSTIHTVIFLMSLVPVAANTVTYATLLNVKPEKAALVVITSTIISLLYIPFMLTLVGLAQ